jgi:nitroreductase/NAD-dependent dihydropyrimidine dehydrogenase PreA subunit
MVNIDLEKCIGCGACVRDCFMKDLSVESGKAVFKNARCIRCGHCIAVCPTNAVTIDGYDMSEVVDIEKMQSGITPDALLKLIKTRRTVRHFKPDKVEPEKIAMLLEAGRFSPTGSNMQDVVYYVVENNMYRLREVIINKLAALGRDVIANGSSVFPLRYAERWLQMETLLLSDPDGYDPLFFHAPLVIFLAGDVSSPINATIAASNMELMVYTQGLGMLYSGFTRIAAKDNPELSEFLGLRNDRRIAACMVIGYPDVAYLRTVPRNKPDVRYI